MSETHTFLLHHTDYSILKNGIEKWSSPSNIALVKYWGKLDNQIPTNPSLSFTLTNSKTITSLAYELKPNHSENFEFDFYFEGKKNDNFKKKITTFWNRILPYVPYLRSYKFTINSENTFPHSSGIASSASGMSALALCLMSLEKKLNPNITEDYFYKKASFLSRLGSGSASRSIYGNLVLWGEHQKIGTNEYAIAYPKNIHSVFKNFNDTITIVEKGEKKISSSVGHSLMNKHPFAERRFKQARENLTQLEVALQNGDIKNFGKIIENEALSLHAMMMTSTPSFILMNPNTLQVINKVWEFRKKTNENLFFTLDAGANVHLLYPQENENSIQNFIKNELAQYCNSKFIFDSVGNGAIKL